MQTRHAVGYDRVFGNYIFRTNNADCTNGKSILRGKARGASVRCRAPPWISSSWRWKLTARRFRASEIVHNTYVSSRLRRRGAIFVEAIEEVTAWRYSCLAPMAFRQRFATKPNPRTSKSSPLPARW